MIVLKFFLGLSYENLILIVTRTLPYKIFYHIPVDEDVSTLTAHTKVTKKHGEDSIQKINESLLVKLKELKLIIDKWIRVESTGVKGSICHPLLQACLPNAKEESMKPCPTVAKSVAKQSAESTKAVSEHN